MHLEVVDLRRPVTRADCADVPRPCPWVSCRHHLYLDDKGHPHRPDIEIDDMTCSCALDFVEENPDGATLERVGEFLGVTRERVRQLETMVKRKVAALGLDNFDEPGALDYFDEPAWGGVPGAHG